MGKLFCYLPSSQLRLYDQLHIYACFKAFPRDLRVSDEGLQCLLPWSKRPCRIIFQEEYNKYNKYNNNNNNNNNKRPCRIIFEEITQQNKNKTQQLSWIAFVYYLFLIY